MPRAYNKPEFGPCAPVAAALLTDWGKEEKGRRFEKRRPTRVRCARQKRNFAAICKMRGSRALVILPKSVESMLPPGLVNCAWLKILKASNLNSRLLASVRLMSFNKAMSQLLRPGPWKKRRLELPICPRASLVKREVLK